MLDPNIPLSYRPPNIDTLGEAATKTQTLRQMMEEEAIKGAFVVGPDGQIDRQATMANLVKKNPQFAYKQGREWRIDDTQDQTANLRQQELDARVKAQEAKARAFISGKLKGAAGKAAGLFLMNDDPNAAKQAYGQEIERIMRELNMDEQEKQGFLKTMGGPDEFTMEGAQAFLRGDHDESLKPMVDHFLKTRGPQLMTDEGEIVGGSTKSEDGTFIPTGPVAEEGEKWFTRPPRNAEEQKKWGALLSIGRANKWFKGNEPYLSIPDAGVTVKNPFYWQAKEDDYKLRSKYKVGTGTEVNNIMPGALPPGKAGANTVDDSLFKAGSRKQRLAEVKTLFKPEYLEMQNVTGDWWRNLKDKFGQASPQDKEKLEGFAKFYQVAFADMNAAIKEASGATVTDGEAGRMEKEMPKPPTGPLDFAADGPARYAAKLNQAMRNMELAEARLVWIKRNGYSLTEGADKLPLDRVPALIQSRGNALLKDAEKQGLKGDAAKKEVRRRLAEEFGLAQ
jgi:hypothetical protein